MTELVDDTALSNTFIEMRLDASGKEIERLQAINAELLEALKKIQAECFVVRFASEPSKVSNILETASEAIRKAEEQVR